MMKTLIIFVAAVTLAIMLGLTAFKNQIALYLFQQTIERQVSWDIRDDLPEGLHVAFCGTGSPLPDPGRGGACTAVIADGRVFEDKGNKPHFLRIFEPKQDRFEPDFSL